MEHCMLGINYLFPYYNLCEHLQGLIQSTDGTWRVDGLPGPWPCPATLVPSSTHTFPATQFWEVGTTHISLMEF